MGELNEKLPKKKNVKLTIAFQTLGGQVAKNRGLGKKNSGIKNKMGLWLVKRFG